jgi:hypothetical protein
MEAPPYGFGLTIYTYISSASEYVPVSTTGQYTSAHDRDTILASRSLPVFAFELASRVHMVAIAEAKCGVI